MLIPNVNSQSLDARRKIVILSSFDFCLTGLVEHRILMLQSCLSARVQGGSSKCATHGASCLDLVREKNNGLIVQPNGGDLGGYGHICPLRHASFTECMITSRPNRSVEKKMAYRAKIIVFDVFLTHRRRGVILRCI